MAKKADLDLVKLILKRNFIDTQKIAQIIQEINVELDQDQEEKPKPMKKQFVTLISDPEGVIEGKDLTGWVVQIPEDDNPAIASEKLLKSAYDYNATPKGSKFPVETIGEACEIVPPKVTKEHNIWIKTKTPILMIPTDNKIPTETIDDGGYITVEDADEE